MKKSSAVGIVCALRFAGLLTCLSVLAAGRAWPDAPQFEFHAPQSATDPKTPAIMRDLAERLLPVYQESDPYRYLANLSALQLVAGNYAAADESRESLRERRRSADAGRPAARSVITDLYAHARAVEVDQRIPFAEAFAKSYRDWIPRLGDQDAYAVGAWLATSPAVYRLALQAAFDQDRARDGLQQAEAVELIRTYLAFDAYRSFSPFVDSLNGEDDHRRYVTDSQTLVGRPGGTRIELSIVRPRNPAAALPALLEYTLSDSPNYARASAAHGYIGVAAYAHLQGRGSRLVPFQHDGQNARAAINWIARQPWSDGHVGMYGEGYSGFAAWAAAKRAPPALKAIATSASTAPGIDMPMQGGIFRNSAYRWSLHPGDTGPAGDSGEGQEGPWRALDRKWYQSGRRYRDLGRLFGKPNPIFIRWLNHPSYDRYWQNMVPYRKEFAHLAIPVLTSTGYYADSEPGDLYFFTEHHRYDPHADHILIVGPYDDRAVLDGPTARLHGLPVDAAAAVDLQELRFQWFDHVLKGGALPALLKDRVNYEPMGANEWRHVSSIDAMATGSVRYYLGAGASGGGHRLVQNKPSRATFVRQSVSLTDRSDAAWTAPTGLVSRSPELHNGSMFVSEPLNKPLEFSGLFSGRLDFTVNKMDVDLNIAVYELLANGDYVRLFSPAYEFRASYAQDRVHRRLLRAGERQSLSFKSERIASRQLQSGSRVVVVLSVTKQANREINYGTGDDVSEESIADGRVPLNISWFGDSFIDLPVRR